MATLLVYTVPPYVPFTKILSANANQDKADIKSRINWAGGTDAATGLGDDNVQSNAASGGGLTRATKLKIGTVNAVVINDGTGKMSDEAQLSLVRGGLGVDFNAISKSTGDAIVWTGTQFTSSQVTPVASPSDVRNIAFSTSVSSSNLTVALKDRNLATPSAGSPVVVIFRNATPATGDSAVRNVTSALSVVIPSGADLGATAAVDQFIYVWALDNAGTVELAVSGSRDFDEGSVQNTTTISGSSTDHTVLYSTTGRTGVAIRLLARLRSNQTVAGVYASNTTEISLVSSKPWPESTPWRTDLSFTPHNFGSVVGTEYFYKRVGDTMRARLIFESGSPSASAASIGLPTGISLDDDKISAFAKYYAGRFNIISNGGSPSPIDGNEGTMYTDPGAGLDRVTFALVTNNQHYSAANATDLAGSGTVLSIEFEVPIKEWRSY